MLYDNTTMRENRNSYDISPAEGYLLHNIVFDKYESDSKQLISRGYSPSSCSVGKDYDFEANPKEIYAIKRDDVGENDVIY